MAGAGWIGWKRRSHRRARTIALRACRSEGHDLLTPDASWQPPGRRRIDLAAPRRDVIRVDPAARGCHLRARVRRAGESCRDSRPPGPGTVIAGYLRTPRLDGPDAPAAGEERLAILFSRRLCIRGGVVARTSQSVGVWAPPHRGRDPARRQLGHAAHRVRDGCER